MVCVHTGRDPKGADEGTRPPQVYHCKHNLIFSILITCNEGTFADCRHLLSVFNFNVSYVLQHNFWCVCPKNCSWENVNVIVPPQVYIRFVCTTHLCTTRVCTTWHGRPFCRCSLDTPAISFIWDQLVPSNTPVQWRQEGERIDWLVFTAAVFVFKSNFESKRNEVSKKSDCFSPPKSQLSIGNRFFVVLLCFNRLAFR